MNSTRTLLTLTLIIFLILPFVAADGMSYKRYTWIPPGHDLPKEDWALLAENSQTALIEYNDGVERLSIAIDVEKADAEEVVWIFPVPAEPQNSRINLNLDIPEFFGDDVVQLASERIWGFANGMRNTLGLPLIVGALSGIDPTFGLMSTTSGIGRAESAADSGIIVYEHAELYGIVAELITARDGTSIYSYLENKGLTLPQEAVSILNEYVGKDYSFVVGWIEDYNEFLVGQTKTKKRLLAVSISFPTEELYFPLKPTSVYGYTTIPINVYVQGYVSPEIYDAIKPSTKVTYLLNDEAEIELQKKFTQIDIHAFSNTLTEDLWIKNSAPFNVGLADSVYYHDYLWFILFLLIVSCFSSLLVGNIVFLGKGVKQKYLLFFGATNLLTIFSFILTVAFWDFKKNWFNEKLKYPKINKNDRIVFIAAFIIVFVVLTYIIEAAWASPPREWTQKEVPYRGVSGVLCETYACTIDADCTPEETYNDCPMGDAYCNSALGRCELFSDNYVYY